MRFSLQRIVIILDINGRSCSGFNQGLTQTAISEMGREIFCKSICLEVNIFEGVNQVD